jgi:hypothetical protein
MKATRILGTVVFMILSRRLMHGTILTIMVDGWARCGGVMHPLTFTRYSQQYESQKINIIRKI